MCHATITGMYWGASHSLPPWSKQLPDIGNSLTTSLELLKMSQIPKCELSRVFTVFSRSFHGTRGFWFLFFFERSTSQLAHMCFFDESKIQPNRFHIYHHIFHPMASSPTGLHLPDPGWSMPKIFSFTRSCHTWLQAMWSGSRWANGGCNNGRKLVKKGSNVYGYTHGTIYGWVVDISQIYWERNDDFPYGSNILWYHNGWVMDG